MNINPKLHRRINKASAGWSWLETGLAFIFLGGIIYEMVVYGAWAFLYIYLAYLVISLINSLWCAYTI